MNVLLAILLLTACGTPEPEPAITPAATAAAPFTNAEGKLVCPVMGDVIASEAHATSHLEHDGLVYYFCCSSCEDAFKANPAKYARGAALKTGHPDEAACTEG